MKKFFFCALWSITLIGFYSCKKEKIEEPSKMVDVCFDVKFIESGSMTRNAEDVYQEFYNKHILTKELVQDNYDLTIKDENGNTVAEISGYWDATTIQLPTGTYTVKGSSNGGGDYSIVSLIFDEVIKIQSSGTILLTPKYDCFLLLFPTNNGTYKYQYINEVYQSSNKYTDLPIANDVAYLFLRSKGLIDYIQYSDGTDRCKLSFKSDNFNFQHGYYYYFSIVTGTFYIPPMENGSI